MDDHDKRYTLDGSMIIPSNYINAPLSFDQTMEKIHRLAEFNTREKKKLECIRNQTADAYVCKSFSNTMKYKINRFKCSHTNAKRGSNHILPRRTFSLIASLSDRGGDN